MILLEMNLGAHLRGDQGRETALLDEAHLDGWLAIN
jgi:hypothetical protein